MQVIKPVRLKRKRESEAGPEDPEITPAESAQDTQAEIQAEIQVDHPPAPTRGLLRKSAIRRFLKKEFDFPLQIREAFFAAAEAKFAEDLRRSVARARELKRNTLMAPDA
jgi:histone H3/H4